MMAFDAMEPEHLAFLYELYTRSAGDARQGVPYEALIDALGFDERVTKRIQRALEREGLVDLTTVPSMTHMGRPVMDHAPRHRRQQTIGMTPHGMRLMEDLFATRADTARPTPSASSDYHTTEIVAEAPPDVRSIVKETVTAPMRTRG
jgi:hypothetical protein